MNNFPVQFDNKCKKIYIQFRDINAEEAEQTFLSSKLALDTVSDAKKKIEVVSQFKRARARFV